jgi:hypothetical protein
MRAVSSIAVSQIFDAEGTRAAFGWSMTPVVMSFILSERALLMATA